MSRQSKMLTWLCHLYDIQAISYKDQGCVNHIQYFRIRPGDNITVLEKCDRLIKILTATIFRWVQCLIRVIRDLDILHTDPFSNLLLDLRIQTQVLVHWTLRKVRTDLITDLITCCAGIPYILSLHTVSLASQYKLPCGTVLRIFAS